VKKIRDFFVNNKAVWVCLLGSLLLNITIEMMYRKSLSAFWGYVSARPLAFVQNVLILLMTISLCLFVRRKWFLGVLIGAGWAALGVTNMLLLGYRVSPFSAIDFSILQLDWSFIGIYASIGTIVGVIAAIVLMLIGLALLIFKSPRSPVHPVRSAITLGIVVLGVLVLPKLPLQSGFAGEIAYKDVINLTEQYGFVYTFSRSVVDRGIDKPEDYSARRVQTLVNDVLRTEDKVCPEKPNLVFVQLESFFDVNYLEGVEFSEDPIPFFRHLKDTCPSGFFTVPSIGAGTANTEFEVLTQMDVHMFGTGEYPYVTTLQDEPCESIAYNLRDIGYATHAIHNNTATFYDRNKAYPNLGFGTFTSLEYMQDVEYTEIGWAKDEILLGCITDALDSTEERDFVFAISVQGHGPAPEDGAETKIKVVSGVEEEELHGELEYYATQLSEMDAFLCTLARKLEAREEPTVLVLYGDHMPALGIENEMLEDGNTYTTEYVVWANYDLRTETEDQDLKAYQLASQVFGMLDMNVGSLTKFHQMNDWSGAYETELLTLQYDMMDGERILYRGENPYEPVKMRFGTKDVVLEEATVRWKTIVVKGENFTPFSVIRINGEEQETEFISDTELRCTLKELPEPVKVSVCQIAEDGTVLSTAVSKKE